MVGKFHWSWCTSGYKQVQRHLLQYYRWLLWIQVSWQFMYNSTSWHGPCVLALFYQWAFFIKPRHRKGMWWTRFDLWPYLEYCNEISFLCYSHMEPPFRWWQWKTWLGVSFWSWITSASSESMRWWGRHWEAWWVFLRLHSSQNEWEGIYVCCL